MEETSTPTNPTTVKIYYKKDLDNDGIPDDIDNDIDGDGVPNNEEITYGSNPRDPNSKPQKYTHEPQVNNLSKKLSETKFTEDDIKNAISNKNTFPAGTNIIIDPSVNISTLQDTTGTKKIPLIVKYPD